MNQRAQRGFTLIECLVAIVILGLGIVGVVGCFTAALLSNQKASNIQLATSLAQSVIENMRSYGFGSITYDNFPASIDKNTISDNKDISDLAEQLGRLHSGRATTTITNNYNGDARLKQVAVEISWRSINNSHPTVRLESVISNRTGHTGGG
jgi:prepilin-type N-terminal cleavage/methylation domain-containing protein